jgi:hypothetical protein
MKEIDAAILCWRAVIASEGLMSTSDLYQTYRRRQASSPSFQHYSIGTLES